MRIGEAAEAAGLATKTLRFYEDFGLLPEPGRSANGYRDYGEEILTRLQFIRRGRAAGLKLRQIREILQIRDTGQAPCNHVQGLLAEQLDNLDQRIAELVAMRATVAQFYQSAATDSPSCQPEQICSYI